MAILKRSLKASTLVEVIVAMTIIMITTAIITTFISNNQRSINISVKIKALTLSDNIMEMYKTQLIFNENTSTEKKDGFIVNQSLSNYLNSSRLKILTVIIADVNGKTIVSRRKIILADQ